MVESPPLSEILCTFFPRCRKGALCPFKHVEDEERSNLLNKIKERGTTELEEHKAEAILDSFSVSKVGEEMGAEISHRKRRLSENGEDGPMHQKKTAKVDNTEEFMDVLSNPADPGLLIIEEVPSNKADSNVTEEREAATSGDLVRTEEREAATSGDLVIHMDANDGQEEVEASPPTSTNLAPVDEPMEICTQEQNDDQEPIILEGSADPIPADKPDTPQEEGETECPPLSEPVPIAPILEPILEPFLEPILEPPTEDVPSTVPSTAIPSTTMPSDEDQNLNQGDARPTNEKVKEERLSAEKSLEYIRLEAASNAIEALLMPESELMPKTLEEGQQTDDLPDLNFHGQSSEQRPDVETQTLEVATELSDLEMDEPEENEFPHVKSDGSVLQPSLDAVDNFGSPRVFEDEHFYSPLSNPEGMEDIEPFDVFTDEFMTRLKEKDESMLNELDRKLSQYKNTNSTRAAEFADLLNSLKEYINKIC